VRVLEVGRINAVDVLERPLTPLVEWTARERLAQFGPDPESPVAIVAPLGDGAEASGGAIALVYDAPITRDREELKEWLVRHGERFALVDALVRTHGELATMNRRTRLLLRESRQWDVEDRPDDLGARLCSLVTDLTGADGAALVRWDGRARRGTVVAADGRFLAFAGATVDAHSLIGGACHAKVPHLWHDVAGEADAPPLFGPDSQGFSGCVLVQPLRRRSAIIGAVVATHADPGALGMAEMRTLSLFDAVAGFRLASAWKLEEVSRRALIDGLTGLTNRRGFDSEMRVARSQQLRFGWQIALVIVDIDHFKIINDTHGHDAGDAVLRAVTSVLEAGVRTTDVCARIGGEEFALVLKDTGAVGAHELAERLRAGVESLRLRARGRRISVTASFGVATYPADVHEWDTLFTSADRALYEAKARGRNRVVSFAEIATEAHR
jgi:diguanylate cyclase (GGDEF)-like protein